MKKIISLVSSVLMLFLITFGISFNSYAAQSSGRCGLNAFWIYDKATGTLTISGDGKIDAQYTQYLSTIPQKKVKSVIIEEGITEIDSLAFWRFSELINVNIQNGLTNIESGAFLSCANLSCITIPNSVEIIGDIAFYNCGSLTSVTIGNGVSSIGIGAFYECTNLKNVFYAGSEEEWNSIKIEENKEGNACLLNANIHYLSYIADNAAFLAAIKEAFSYNRADYTKETIEALYSVLDRYAYLVNTSAEQNVYDMATAEILNAIRNLDALSEYSIVKVSGTTILLSKNGFITTINFEDYINQICKKLDVVNDGTVNAKDYAYLLNKY